MCSAVGWVDACMHAWVGCMCECVRERVCWGHGGSTFDISGCAWEFQRRGSRNCHVTERPAYCWCGIM